MNKFLILGGGSNLARCFRSLYANESILVAKSECDITSPESLEKIFEKYKNKFKYVLNCAAMTDSNLCEDNPVKCFSVNTTGTYLLNQTCRKFEKKLIHISSDYALFPTSAYSWSKALAEKVVDSDFLVVRTNFYSKKTYIIRMILENQPFNVFKNVFFNPVSINELARSIYKQRNKRGIINIFSVRKISYFQFAKDACRTFSRDVSILKPINLEVKKLDQIRPMNSYIKPDVKIYLKRDLINFKNYLYENNE